MKIQRMPDGNLKIGRIIEVDGTHIKAELDYSINELTKIYQTEVYSIGQFGSIIKAFFGNTILFMFVTRLRLRSDIEAERGNAVPPGEDSRILEADLFGEGHWGSNASENAFRFERGISKYPLPQQEVFLTTVEELKHIYDSKDINSVKIGTYVGTDDISCYANIDEMFAKHTAILGSTGAGKSAAVAAVIHSIMKFKSKENQSDWNPHIVILDPHNEYSSAFINSARLVSDDGTLKLPYWLLNFQELTDLIIGKTEFQATSQTNILKKALIESRIEGCTKLGIDPQSISIDSPVPFSLNKLREIVDADKPTQASKQEKHLGILNKIDMLRADSRLNFLVSEWAGEQDGLGEVIYQFINYDKPIRIIDLSGIPNDVAGIVSATIARLLFMYKLWETEGQRATDPILLVCEEAHRYVPNRGEAEYASAQDAIKRVAKEGRKYGVGLMLVSQRPSEIEPTVLSQCNSWIVLRLTNSEDQAYVLKFLPDSLSGLGKILPSLRRREALFIGQAASIPARILINKLSTDELPKSHDISFVDGWLNKEPDENFVKQIITRWRTQMRSEYEGASPSPSHMDEEY